MRFVKANIAFATVVCLYIFGTSNAQYVIANTIGTGLTAGALYGTGSLYGAGAGVTQLMYQPKYHQPTYAAVPSYHQPYQMYQQPIQQLSYAPISTLPHVAQPMPLTQPMYQAQPYVNTGAYLQHHSPHKIHLYY